MREEMDSRRLGLVVAGVCGFLSLGGSGPAEAFGFKERGTSWPQGRPIEFRVNMANASSTFPEAQVLEFVQRGLEPWARIETADLPLRVGPALHDAGKTAPVADGLNVIFWQLHNVPRTDMVDGRAYPFASECDIELHPRAPFTLRDVQAIVMHEIGHCLGLAHSAATGVMKKFSGLPMLGQDDAVAVSLRYPRAARPLGRATATIRGRVVQDGRPLVGAVLRVEDRRTQRIVVAGFSGLVDGQRRVDPSGRFELPGVPSGPCRLTVEPMDAFVAADPPGYGAPVPKPPPSFTRVQVDLGVVEAGEHYDVGSVVVE
jgi:hypothetical protein